MKRPLQAWIGVVALAVGALRVVDHYVSPRAADVMVWLSRPAPGVPRAIEIALLLTKGPGMLLILASALVMFVLWRRTWGPGAGVLLAASVLELLLIVPTVITTFGYAFFMGAQPNVMTSARVVATLLYVAALGALAVGLLRSRIVHPWIPWLALLATPAILGSGLFWGLVLYGWLPPLNGAGVGDLLAALDWVFVAPAVFWLALGTDLILRARKVPTETSDRFLANGAVPAATE